MNKLVCLILFLGVCVKTFRAQSSSTTSPTIACVARYDSSLVGECKSVDQCAGAVLRGNCSGSSICCIRDNAKTDTQNSIITKNIFLKLVNNTVRNNALYSYFAESMNLAQINTEYKAAAYFSQLVGESDFFRNLESGLIDSDSDNDLGNNVTGDGTKYQGRGAILLRGKTNYLLANSKIPNLGFNIIDNPIRVAFPSVAFKIAAWFWRENAFIIKSKDRATKGNLNELADGTFHNFTLLTHSLTNNIQKLKDRATFNDLVLAELNYGTMKRGLGIECELNGEKGYSIPICLLDFKKPYCGCEGQFDMRSCPYGIITGRPDKCRNSAVLKCCVEKCQSALDLVILMDSSGSIGTTDFKKEQDFVIKLVSNLKIGLNDTRVAIINFNSRPYLIANFLNSTDLNKVSAIVNGIVYNGGATYTYDALRMANEQVLQENKGMRPVEQGVPKVVVVITDGASQDMKKTLAEAKRIKDRGYSVISVGVGKDINLVELIGIASTPADQYNVADFNQILLILSSLSKTTCQQPAPVITETEISSKVEKNSYKYYKYNLDDLTEDPSEKNKFTIELKELSGECELFYSFVEENPKSDDEFINSNSIKPDKDENFIEKILQRFKRSQQISDSTNKKSKLYQITRPNAPPNEVLYFSVKGLDTNNEFQVYVYNKTVVYNRSCSLKTENLNFFIFFTIFMGFFSLRQF